MAGTIEDLVQAIIRQEDPQNPRAAHARMVAGFGKYNPGHLMYAGQTGAVPVSLYAGGRAWAGWNSWEEGVQGIRNQIRRDAKRGLNLEQFINKYAPASENPTSAYVGNVEAWAGIDRRTPLVQIGGVLGGSSSGGSGPGNLPGYGDPGWPEGSDEPDGSGGGGEPDLGYTEQITGEGSELGAAMAIGAGLLVLALIA